MASTAELRIAWAPACSGPFIKLYLHGDGAITIREATKEAFEALNAVLIKFDYETRKDDTGAYNCRIITGGTQYSLHAYGIAADINWLTNPYGSILITDMPIAM